ncbi:MAG: hypothetical protein ACJ76W_03605 [Chloroflexota bacterium]
MSASEFAFLALGLLLGAASGAALVEVLRARPPTRPEIRVTVAPNSIPRRASTLAEADNGDPGPARGGPADRRGVDRDPDPLDEVEREPGAPPTAAAAASISSSAGVAGEAATAATVDDHRTAVPYAAPPMSMGLVAAGPGVGAVAVAAPRAPVGIPIAREPDPMVAALRSTAATAAVAAMGRNRPESAAAKQGATFATTTVAPPVIATASADGVTRSEPPSEPSAQPIDAAGAGRQAAPSVAPDDACADQRRVADERCAVAARAREGAATALETLRTTQREYDDLVNRAETAAATADPRSVRAAKEAAQQAFRAARAAGSTRDDVEAAARDWLTEINRINIATRDATSAAERHRRAAAELAATLERLSVDADAARISSDIADEACMTAREAVAACQETAALASAGNAGEQPAAATVAQPGTREDLATPMASRAGDDAAIIRLLRGDREVMSRVVASLAGDDEAERRRWQALIGAFVEALIARTIEASAFDFPLEDSFWSPFTRSQARDIAGALASLGYRHDGFGGWAEDRVPSQRDLSLAVGYAGLDPMRIRRWPSEAEMPDLLREVTVAADEYVWEAAGGLTLGELVSLLGRRAEGLAELWNEWGNVRPLLLSAD